MNPWTEDNFLERLMPRRRRENGVQVGLCPDSELLSAFTEDQVSPFLRDAIAAHLTQCPKCQEIYERLGQFAQASVPVQDAEWVNAEKRLDNWMRAFLGSKHDEAKPSLAPPTTFKNQRKWFGVWHMRPAWNAPLAAGMAGILLAIGLLFLRQKPVGTEVAEVARNNQTHSQAARAQASQDLTPGTVTPSSEPGSAVPNQQMIATKDAGAKASAASHRTVPAVTQNSVAEMPPATATPLPPASARAKTAPLNAPAARPAPNVQIAEAGSPPPPVGRPASPQSRVPARGVMPGPASGFLGSGVRRGPTIQNSSETAVNPAASVPAPPTAAPRNYFQLKEGTRIWIFLSSVSQQPDGRFTFVGTVLLPVVQDNTVVLDRGAEVDGSGSTNQKQASVTITRYVVAGTPYAVNGSGGAAVQFDAGQVLEMWLASAASFSRITAKSEVPR